MTVRDFPRDCNVKDVRAFIGLAKLLSQIGEKRCRHRYTSHSPHPEEHMHVNNIRIFEHMHMNKTCIFVWTVVDEYKRFKSSHSFCYKSTIITSDPSPLIPVKYWHYHVSIIDHIGKLARWELRPGTINDNALSPCKYSTSCHPLPMSTDRHSVISTPSLIYISKTWLTSNELL